MRKDSDLISGAFGSPSVIESEDVMTIPTIHRQGSP